MGIIADMRRKQKEKDAAWNRNIAEYNRSMGIFDKEVRLATASQYNEWIAGFIANGGQPTHCYDYPMSNQRFYVAMKDFKLLALFGSRAINVIVPKGIEVKSDDLGHSHLYFMDGFTCRGGFVPIFEDTEEVG